MQDQTSPLENGTRLTDVDRKYLIHEEEIIGRGAWSVVKKCVPIPPYVPPGSRSDMKFVVKIIEKEYLILLTKGDVDRAMAEVKREIDVLRHIPPHENVVTFIEYIETEKYFLLFFEQVCCGDLCELILQNPKGRLSEEKAKLYTYQIIKAVLHCHLHDIIHRDVKPENLLVSDKEEIKLTDFGLAKYSKGVCTNDEPRDLLDVTALMMPYPGCERLVGKRVVCSDVIGTPRYGAPEMFYAKFTQTHYDGFCADTWSIGVVTYIMVAGSFPYSAGSSATEREVFRDIMDTPLAQPPNVSALALDFIQRLLNKDPTRRTPLYAALNHPWLVDIIDPRGSVVVNMLRQDNTKLDIETICNCFDAEAKKLHICVGKLQHEVTLLREERDRLLDLHTSREEVKTPPRRAQTPNGISKVRQARSPASSRISTPGSLGMRSRLTSGRDGSSSRTPRKPLAALTVRTRSPLVRSADGAAVRSGTPVRTGGATSLRTGTSSRSTSCSASAVRSSQTNRTAVPLVKARAGTPNRSATRRTTTPHGPFGGTAGSSSSVANTANELHMNDQVIYKGHRAVVRFNGSTSFGAGIWIGLEMLEGNVGTNDGSSFIDKKQYFACPKGRGVFVRASQVKKL